MFKQFLISCDNNLAHVASAGLLFNPWGLATVFQIPEGFARLHAVELWRHRFRSTHCVLSPFIYTFMGPFPRLSHISLTQFRHVEAETA